VAFGQSSGPPATGKQLRELLDLLEVAGHSDFRDARGPMGFTQRQAGGKFTRDEADEFIARLEAQLHGDGPPAESAPVTRSSPSRAKLSRPAASSTRASGSGAAAALGDVPTALLAAELQRRGWIVVEP
jgi:hypothetical protein